MVKTIPAPHVAQKSVIGAECAYFFFAFFEKNGHLLWRNRLLSIARRAMGGGYVPIDLHFHRISIKSID